MKKPSRTLVLFIMAVAALLAQTQGQIGNSGLSGLSCQQISTAFGGECKRAIDGNAKTDYWTDGTCSHTGLENQPWWKVDLGKQTTVNCLVIRNRAGVTQAIANRLSNIEVRVGDNWNNIDANNLCGEHTAAAGLGEDVTIPCKTPVKGRYLSVRLMKRDYLTMCEVKINGNFKGQGTSCMSMSRPKCQQISTAFGGECKRAIDGNEKTDYWSDGTCSHTGLEDQPWWKVDLGKETTVNRVVIRNRAGVTLAIANRLSDIEVRVGNNWDNIGANKLCNLHHAAAGLGEAVNIQCGTPVKGKYLSVKLLKRDYLTMCEVKINGHFYGQVPVACPVGKWGPKCQTPCGQCSSGTCDQVTGVCKSGSCKKGYQGNKCDKAITCESGWTLVDGTSCYKLLAKKMTQADGLKACQKENNQHSTLLATETEEEFKRIIDYAQKKGIGDLMTSGECQPPTETDPKKRTCRWAITNEKFGFFKWVKGEPNGNGPVVQMWAANNYQWDDISESVPARILCEWKN